MAIAMMVHVQAIVSLVQMAHAAIRMVIVVVLEYGGIVATWMGNVVLAMIFVELICANQETAQGQRQFQTLQTQLSGLVKIQQMAHVEG